MFLFCFQLAYNSIVLTIRIIQEKNFPRTFPAYLGTRIFSIIFLDIIDLQEHIFVRLDDDD
jgi:hypothetical protein